MCMTMAQGPVSATTVLLLIFAPFLSQSHLSLNAPEYASIDASKPLTNVVKGSAAVAAATPPPAHPPITPMGPPKGAPAGAPMPQPTRKAPPSPTAMSRRKSFTAFLLAAFSLSVILHFFCGWGGFGV